MIIGTHTVLFSTEPEATRAFFRDVLSLGSVDAGGGWLIFALPPGELGVHPTNEGPQHELYLLCDEVTATVADLTARGAEFEGPPEDQRFGIVARMRVPGAGTIGVYQPHHPIAAG
jgi:hypothetical protein